MRDLNITDQYGDSVSVETGVGGEPYLYVGDDSGNVQLGLPEVLTLRDYLTEWLGDQPADVQENPDPSVPPSTILEDAQAAVYGDREGDYGHPRQNFTRTAIGWHMVLLDKLAEGESITPEDVALCMVQVKVAREAHSPKRDNRVDGAGYFLTLDRLETGR